VLCDGACVYSNECLATAAGFANGTCTSICPSATALPENTACPLNYAPIYCQGCSFDNDCIATAFGFNVSTDCVSITTPTTRATATEPTSGATGNYKSVVAVVVMLIATMLKA
jgi:hypothetical protein